MKSSAFSQTAKFGVSCYFDGYWSKWLMAEACVYGGYSGFIIYFDDEGKWNYRFKFTIDDMKFPNRKQRKKDIKNNKFYEFVGTVEYYISDDFPSMLSVFRKHKRFYLLPAKLDNGRPTKKVTSKAVFKVQAFKDLPRVYNMWFDDVGIAIDLGSVYFQHKEEYN